MKQPVACQAWGAQRLAERQIVRGSHIKREGEAREWGHPIQRGYHALKICLPFSDSDPTSSWLVV
jgi:hypothetical protein